MPPLTAPRWVREPSVLCRAVCLCCLLWGIVDTSMPGWRTLLSTAGHGMAFGRPMCGVCGTHALLSQAFGLEEDSRLLKSLLGRGGILPPLPSPGWCPFSVLPALGCCRYFNAWLARCYTAGHGMAFGRPMCCECDTRAQLSQALGLEE